ncbi:glycerophosphodiester phosphodiesterase [Neobacillus dielmonensis]|uniref:glycerophosphodiester phosphodiesterase n=1 Tax=Neobacillus dielmonensis TaxID=1347369 RepID=UPI0005A914AD|nr:glycerophosphodiester phosphodiesterase [Neobacillus dielmonensis]
MKPRFIAGLACLFLSLTITVPWAVTVLASKQIFTTIQKPFPKHPIASQVSIIAHRGASAYAPEHTLAAYKRAMEMKADYLEIDLQMTRDGQLIAMHDETLARTTNAKQLYPNRAPWSVKDFTLEEIRRLDAGSWFSEANPKLAQKENISQRVPTLDEVIQLVKQQGNGEVSLYIETKAPNIYPGMEEKLIAILKKNQVLDDPNLIIESFSEASLCKMKSLAPNIKLIQLYNASMLKGKEIDQEFKRVASYAYGVGPSQELVVPEFVEAAHQNKLVVHPWTVDSQDDMADLRSLGVDGVFTNTPDQLVELLK